MIFLNPYDLADAIGFEKVNPDNLKIFKKQVLTELDLLDDEIKINDTVFSKSNCLEVFSVIDSNKKTLEYFRIAQELKAYKFNEPENIYSFIEIKTTKETNRIVWHLGSNNINIKVIELYNKLILDTN